MGLSELQALYNMHCRFKLRSGREVFGVIWEIDTLRDRKLFFASVQDYKRVMSGIPVEKTGVVALPPDEIMWGQRIAS